MTKKKKNYIELEVDSIGGEAPLTEAEMAELDAYFLAKKLERQAQPSSRKSAPRSPKSISALTLHFSPNFSAITGDFTSAPHFPKTPILQGQDAAR